MTRRRGKGGVEKNDTKGKKTYSTEGMFEEEREERRGGDGGGGGVQNKDVRPAKAKEHSLRVNHCNFQAGPSAHSFRARNSPASITVTWPYLFIIFSTSLTPIYLQVCVTPLIFSLLIYGNLRMAHILRAHLRRRHSLWMSIATTQTLAARFGGQSVLSFRSLWTITG